MFKPQPNDQDLTATTWKTKVRAVRLRGKFGIASDRKNEPASLLRLATVAFQKPAELLLATNVGQGNRGGLRRQLSSPIAFGLNEQLIFHPLVRPRFQVIRNPGFQDTIEMLDATRRSDTLRPTAARFDPWSLDYDKSKLHWAWDGVVVVIIPWAQGLIVR
jgi:hypothetical protein